MKNEKNTADDKNLDAKAEAMKAVNKKASQVEPLLNLNENKAIINTFIEKFIYCEVYYKIILGIYYKHKKKQNIKIKDMKIDLREGKAAIQHCNYCFDNEILDKIFKSKDVNNQHTARILRNDIVHDLKQSSIEDVLKRKDELFECMDIFIDGVKNGTDSTTATDEAAVTAEQ